MDEEVEFIHRKDPAQSSGRNKALSLDGGQRSTSGSEVTHTAVPVAGDTNVIIC